METRRGVLTRRLCGFVLVALTAPAAAADTSRVVLQVQSKSWVRDSTFDTADFDQSCEGTGIELASPTGHDPFVATAVVTYTETKGPGFSRFGVGTPVGYGTNIAYKLTLLDAKTAKTIMTVTASAETPAGLPPEQFHDGARDAFKANPAYKFSCAAIAAALGSRQQMARLLPWALVDRQVPPLLDKMGFRAETPEERAYLAVGKNDFSALRGLDAAAVEPLLLLFTNSRNARDGIGLFGATDAEHARTLTRALAVLAPIKDDRIAEALVDFLNDYSDFRTTDDPVVTPVLVETIRVLGRVGTVFTIPALEEWQGGDGAVAKEARTATTALRTRFSVQ